MSDLLRIMPRWVCCPRRPWLCIADVVTRCKVPAICDTHDRWITHEYIERREGERDE